MLWSIASAPSHCIDWKHGLVQALIEETERQQSFYYYDTVAASGADLKHRTFRVDNPHEHRLMLAAILKNSSYYFANRSYVCSLP